MERASEWFESEMKVAIATSEINRLDDEELISHAASLGNEGASCRIAKVHSRIIEIIITEQ